MSNKPHYPLECTGLERKVVAGRFRPNGGANPDNTLNIGKGFTVVRNGSAGQYKVTLSDKYNALENVELTLFKATDAGHALRVVSEQVATDGSFVIEYKENAAGTFTATDLASAAATWIGFTAVLKNTMVNG